jgi:hypothetical protein
MPTASSKGSAPLPKVHNAGPSRSMTNRNLSLMFYLSIFELTLTVGSAGSLDPPFHRSVGVKAIE